MRQRIAGRNSQSLTVTMLGFLEVALAVTDSPNVHPGARRFWVEFQRFLVGFDHLTVGLAGLGTSVVSQVQAARNDYWSLSDDVLPRLAGPYADVLRAWRDRIAEQDVVLVLDSDPKMWNATLWALHPRRIYPRVLEVPRDMSSDEIADAARKIAPPHDGAACWVVDLGVLKSPAGAGHPPLVRVDG